MYYLTKCGTWFRSGPDYQDLGISRNAGCRRMPRITLYPHVGNSQEATPVLLGNHQIWHIQSLVSKAERNTAGVVPKNEDLQAILCGI